MLLTVRVKPKAKQPSVTTNADGSFVVAVHEAPTDGRANDAVKHALAKHFNVAPYRVSIRYGKTSRSKVVEIT